MAPNGHSVALQIAGSQITFETGRIARQSSGAVLARLGETVVLGTVVAAPAAKPGADFLPLTVEYREKMAAAGRIPGSFARREGRITDHEILVSRLIDRTVRSLFPDEYRCEVQIQATVLSADPDSDVATVALLAAAAALHLSPVPCAGPAAGMRIVRHRGQYVAFPAARQRDEAELDFVVGAGPSGLVMVEGGAREASEARCLEALEVAQQWLGRLQRTFAELRELAGRPKLPSPPAPALPEVPAAVQAQIEAAVRIAEKAARHAAIDGHKEQWLGSLPEAERTAAGRAFDESCWRIVRAQTLAGRRIDGRGLDEIRPIWCETGWLPRTHGSAVFTRGETQALVTCTLGTEDDAQLIDGLGGLRNERFLLHYNFPPYSVNEVRPLRGPGRREIGHGALARRGLLPVMPDFAAFPYTTRVESEISESNGSSSMATVCGGTLALFDAGVPLKAPVAGIAMGLIRDGDRAATLSDILGDEDHLGDMDFKVVGTADGVTALQLDNKVGGLSAEVLRQALEQAARGRRHILHEMGKAMAGPRRDASKRAPHVERVAILPDAIGALVGTRGANIKAIQAETKSRITVSDDGIVLIYAPEGDAARKARRAVLRCAGVVVAGMCYRGVVTGVKDFGAFVRINPMNEGLVPAAQFGAAPSEGAELIVRVEGADERGRLQLALQSDADPARIVF
jgi:polyribonucleotide nucleotidyltransferase